ncbi:unnamed protein product, partial [Nesidiocoris tenuis]
MKSPDAPVFLVLYLDLVTDAELDERKPEDSATKAARDRFFDSDEWPYSVIRKRWICSKS